MSFLCWLGLHKWLPWDGTDSACLRGCGMTKLKWIARIRSVS